jgi:hypothetical protein
MKKILVVACILIVTLAPIMYAFQKLNANIVLIVHIALMSLLINYIFRHSKKEDMLIALTLSIIVPFFEGYMIKPHLFDQTVFVWGSVLVSLVSIYVDVLLYKRELNIKIIVRNIAISSILVGLRMINVI